MHEVKEAFAKTIVGSGYRVGAVANAVLEREAPRIAKTTDEMRGVQRFVEGRNGVEHGFCYSLYPDNQIQRMGYFRNGNRIGPWRFFLPSGALATKVQYDADGEKIGQTVFYLRNGNVHYVETYTRGMKHGPKTTFHGSGTTHSHQMWQNGKMHGLSIIYCPNRGLKEFSNLSNGRLHGLVIFYDGTGSVTEEAQHVNGQKQ